MRPATSATDTVHILVAVDDSEMRQLIVDYLGTNDIRVTSLPDARGVEDALARETIDLLIVAVKPPGDDGLRLTQRLRDDSDLPIIMLAGRSDEADRVMGLELGADDYLVKPFSNRELLARVRALLRRCRSRYSVADRLTRIRAYRFQGWELNVRLRRLIRPDGAVVALTNAEFNLLAAFLNAPQCVLSRDQLLELSRLHNDEVYERAIDAQVARLRKKLSMGPVAGDIIRTERGFGYVFAAAAVHVS
ncbi:response regulator [Cupriavidus sp. IDO]|uniref:response regulator n=1 Tax=Cupriavidus sp. IDO TaxID=1539142 RepID=UPI0005796347|nr:response regulator [Cupriavidus sp. IDO]KWR83181.1 two-component system response regulator [Cupriavidus sp. IDO]